MEIAEQTIKDLCVEQGLHLKDLLEQSGVSRTAYYSLVRNDTVLPKSIHSLAEALGVSPSKILIDPAEREKRLQDRLEKLNAILSRNKKANRDNVWHTLTLLEQSPEERLRRGLLRGQTFDFH